MKKTTIYLSLLVLILFMLQCSTRSGHTETNYLDGLPRSIPEKEGIKSGGILKFIESVEENNIELHSFMLLRHGKVVAEGWWNPYQPNIRHIMFSVSKTFTATAIGFAVSENLLSVEDKVVSFFPEYEAIYSENQYMQELTIKNLLTMSVGNEAYADYRQRDPNWVKSFFGVNINAKTTHEFAYNSYAAHMMSAIIEKVTGNTLLDFLKPRLFDPLGIEGITSEQSPAGIHCGGWGMSVKISDMAKLGQLYLQKGKWEGKQLLPESWIDEATEYQITTNPGQSSASDWAQGYGYQIWLCRHNAYRADGAFGQFIIVMPGQDAVLAITAHSNNMQEELQQVWNCILPAISNKELPENNNDYNLLTQKLKSLSLPKPIDKITKIGSEQTKGTYTIDNNELDIKHISINQQGDSCILIIKTTTATHNFLCGNNSWIYNKADRNSPHFNDPIRNSIGLTPFTVAGYYAWEDAQNMFLKLTYMEDGSSETYKIAFGKDDIKIVITNSVEGSDAPPIQLVGNLNKK